MTQFHLFIKINFDSKSTKRDLVLSYHLSSHFLYVSMNPGNTEISPEHSSALQALALSSIEEGIGQNVTRAQGL